MATTNTQSNTVRVPTPKAQRLTNAKEKVAALNLAETKVCCTQHAAKLAELVKAAQSGSFGEKDAAYARDIVMGRARHNSSARTQDATRQVTVQCMHVDVVTGKDKKVLRTRCETKVTGTAAEVGTKKNRCDKHQQ